MTGADESYSDHILPKSRNEAATLTKDCIGKGGKAFKTQDTKSQRKASRFKTKQ